MTHSARLLVLLAIACLAGCKTYVLNQQLSDEELRARLTEHFPPGMSVEQTQAELEQLNVSRSHQFVYPATAARPTVLLARLFPPGGAWIGAGDDTLEWVDVSFVYDRSDLLVSWFLYRDSVRYFEGRAIAGPTRQPMGPVDRWIGGVPPPLDPLEGTPAD